MSNRSLIAFDDTNGHYRKVLCNSTRDLKVETTSTLPTGASTLAEQQSQTTELTLIKTSSASIDGKITACDTSALATEATVSALNTKVVACDTSALATEATVSALNTKVVACNTGAVTVSAMPVVQGSFSGTPTDIQVDSHGCVSVKVKELENSNSTPWNNDSIIASAVSSVVDVSNMTHTNIIIEDSDYTSTDTYTVEVSTDGSKYYYFTTLYPWDVDASTTRRTDRALLELHGVTSLRVVNNGGAKSAVYLMVAGTP